MKFFTIKPAKLPFLFNDDVYVNQELPIRCRISDEVLGSLEIEISEVAEQPLFHWCGMTRSRYTLTVRRTMGGFDLLFIFPPQFHFNGFDVINERWLFKGQIEHAYKAALVHDVLISYQQSFGVLKKTYNLNLREMADFFFDQLLRANRGFADQNRAQIDLVVRGVKWKTEKLQERHRVRLIPPRTNYRSFLF
ncbi:hypothetical protein J8273_5735 [Carpediemonas membranifera]|uniref:Uncharacterized protein n=1 Tax=Carpediemonas membranifera TaxID=201153 RepID=A0A8J6ASH4_9EUKA|nr:hypothetical protein J8273_5735 [Carpediemonas membranifera]|eukprot:KAG9392923.1 hypothetical protein J8273_5735 [Carpediemonas membranifera]